MRVLLTGAGGFIGRHAISHLLSAGFDVHTAGIRPLPKIAGVTQHECNLFEPTQVSDLTTQIRATHLLHFAWYVTPGKYWTSQENVRWLQCSLDLLSAFLAAGGERSVMAGTCAEYDWSGTGYCLEDKTPISPSTLYGTCKAALQMVQARVAAQAGASAAWGRIFHLYGPGEPETRFVPYLIRSFLRGESAKTTNGQQVRDFMHVDDVARGFVALLKSEFVGTANIATGREVLLEEVAKSIATLTGREHLLQLGALADSAADPPRITADVQRLRSLGFVPAYSLTEGLCQTIEWWRDRLP